MWNKKFKLVISLIVLCLLSACMGGGATTPIKYYLVDPVQYKSESIKPVRVLSVEIIDLNIPQYLERFQIASRISESRLEFSDDNQWGENLRKNLLRSLSRNLSKLLSSTDISTPLNRSSSLPDYRVLVHIEQFELDLDNKVKLVARWQLTSNNQSESSDVYSTELASEQTIEKDNYDQMVLSMRQLYGELSEYIADSIIAKENHKLK